MAPVTAGMGDRATSPSGATTRTPSAARSEATSLGRKYGVTMSRSMRYGAQPDRLKCRASAMATSVFPLPKPPTSMVPRRQSVSVSGSAPPDVSAGDPSRGRLGTPGLDTD